MAQNGKEKQEWDSSHKYSFPTKKQQQTGKVV